MPPSSQLLLPPLSLSLLAVLVVSPILPMAKALVRPLAQTLSALVLVLAHHLVNPLLVSLHLSLSQFLHPAHLGHLARLAHLAAKEVNLSPKACRHFTAQIP
jgi:hypothetical protein